MLTPDADTRWLRFSHAVPGLGEFRLRPLDLARDLDLLLLWLRNERARFWGMQDASAEQIRDCYQVQLASAHSWPYIGLLNGRPAFLLETYDPAHDLLAEHYPVRDGDRGMHFLTAPPEGAPRHGYSLAVLRTILGFLFSLPGIRRVVVEPDIANDKIHPLNEAAGFRYERVIVLPHKTARLAFCQREHFTPTPFLEVTP